MASDNEDVRHRTQQSALASQRTKEQGHGRGEQGRFGQWFPLSAKDGFTQWWAGTSPAATEHRVLSFVPYLQKPPTHTQTGSAPVSSTDLSSPPEHNIERVTSNSITDPYGPRQWDSQMVELSGKNRALNEFSVERVGEEVENSLVMLHGYGAGLGFYYRNFEALSRAPGWKLYALDLLGMGRSTRPPFRIHAKDREGRITEAENWFIDALEEWRIKRKLEKFTLLGHSLGGYLAVAYALKYPGRLEKLILASPVGIPEDPYAVNEDLPDPDDSTMANEFTQDAHDTRHGVQPTTADNNNFMKQRDKTASKPAANRPPRRQLPKWVTYLWEANVISPFSLVRWSGPLGPRLVSGWTSRRFSHLPEEEAQALHDYSYSIFRQRGSSEYALSYILAPGVFARNPLIRRIHGVGRQWIQPHDAPTVDGDTPPAPNTSNLADGVNAHNYAFKSPAASTVSLSHASSSSSPAPTASPQRENGIPVILMYGENDWMDVAGGFAAEEKIKAEKRRLLEGKSREEREADRGDAKVIIIKRAGHHVYLDGWEEFNEVMLREMKGETKGRR